MFFGPLQHRYLDTKKFLELPDAKFLLPIMVAVNDILLHETILSNVQTSLVRHRYEKTMNDGQLTILEAQVQLLVRHQQGLIWEGLELLNELSTVAPSILAFINSFPELKNLYDLVFPFCKSDKLRRARNNLAFHFGLKFMDQTLSTISEQPTSVIKTLNGDTFWYQIADEAQAHLLTRTITKIVKNDTSIPDSLSKAQSEGEQLKVIKLNLLSIFLSVLDHFIEPLYIHENPPAN